MKQAVAGVAPPELSEVTSMTVWPSIAEFGLAKTLGRLYGIRAGVGFMTVGKVFMLLTIPLALGMFFYSLIPPIPFFGTYNKRYSLTNRRIIKQHGRLTWRVQKLWGVPVPMMHFIHSEIGSYVDLDRFDAVEVRIEPGQEAYHAGDLVFKKGNVETFRLEGVSRPETFRQTCLKAHMSYNGVRKARQFETAGA